MIGRGRVYLWTGQFWGFMDNVTAPEHAHSAVQLSFSGSRSSRGSRRVA